jgi:hypothetical protein
MELKKLDLSQQLSLIREESERQESVSEMDSPTGEMDSSKGEMDSSSRARGNRKTKEAGGEDKRQNGFDQASVLATLVGLSTEIVSPSSPNTEKRRRFVITSNVIYETVSLFVLQYKLHKKSVLARFDRSLLGYLLFYKSLVQS